MENEKSQYFKQKIVFFLFCSFGDFLRSKKKTKSWNNQDEKMDENHNKITIKCWFLTTFESKIY